MALLQADRADVYMALEETLGVNTGQNSYSWQVESMTGYGPRVARVYAVVVQSFPVTNTVNGVAVTNYPAGGVGGAAGPFTGAKPFGIVQVTVVPGIPRHSGALVNTTYATMDAAVTAVGALVLAAGNPETYQIAGVLAATNPS